MNKKEIMKLQARNREINDSLSAMYEKAEKETRELTAEEIKQEQKFSRELASNHREIMLLADEATASNIREYDDKNARLREILSEIKQQKRDATLTLATKSPANGTSITESGAIPLKINDVIDTKVEGLDAVRIINILTNVVGDTLWPLSADDVVVSVAGEIADTTKQALSFTNIKAVSERVSAAVAVSDRAIANAAFDLVTFVTMKIRKGLNIMLAKRMFSHAAWTDNFKGPFSLVNPGTITLDNNFGKNISREVAKIAKQGFTGNPYLIIDKEIEAVLKYTPANSFPGCTKAVIEDGKLAGYDYVTTTDINGKLDGQGKYVIDEENSYIGIGYFDQLQVQQHDQLDFSVDNFSAAVKSNWSTVFTLNAAFSATELSHLVNGGTSATKPKAFKLLKIVEEQETA